MHLHSYIHRNDDNNSVADVYKLAHLYDRLASWCQHPSNHGKVRAQVLMAHSFNHLNGHQAIECASTRAVPAGTWAGSVTTKEAKHTLFAAEG